MTNTLFNYSASIIPLPILIFKLILTPLIIAAATLAARRWGENIGGLLIGLPLTSGPVSVFFALEQGPAFAAQAAQGAMLGLVAVAVFGLGYTHSSRRLPWYLSAVVSIGLYLLAIWSISFITPGLVGSVVLVPVVLGVSLFALGKPQAGGRSVPLPWWDLPLRMVIATGLLLSITGLAGQLGPKWSGLLSPFPVFTFVMAVFSHRQGGPEATWRLVRGVLSGVFSYLAFFLVVGLLIDKANLWLVYLLATLTALGVNGISLLVMLNSNKGDR